MPILRTVERLRYDFIGMGDVAGGFPHHPTRQRWRDCGLVTDARRISFPGLPIRNRSCHVRSSGHRVALRRAPRGLCDILGCYNHLQGLG